MPRTFADVSLQRAKIVLSKDSVLFVSNTHDLFVQQLLHMDSAEDSAEVDSHPASSMVVQLLAGCILNIRLAPQWWGTKCEVHLPADEAQPITYRQRDN
jgi:hypothetical protein